MELMRSVQLLEIAPYERMKTLALPLRARIVDVRYEPARGTLVLRVLSARGDGELADREFHVLGDFEAVPDGLRYVGTGYVSVPGAPHEMGAHVFERCLDPPGASGGAGTVERSDP